MIKIKQLLSSSDSKILSKKLGYQNIKKFEQTLAHFLASDTIEKWLLRGHYDFVLSAEDFFIKLASALDIDKEEVLHVVKKVEEYKLEKQRFKYSYIFINTNFKRKNEPIFTLAVMQNKRIIRLNDKEELFYKSKEENLNIISKYIRNHYKLNDGKLKIWGTIDTYNVHLEDEIFIFDVNGVLQEDAVNISEGRATLSLK